jgi:putative nucleotidyltransferase with HDIG domain
MTLPGADAAESSYLFPEQLYVGAFVTLDLPWFKHSFTLNSFKVRSEHQVRELRALKLPRYRYDPQRSDPAPSTVAVPTPAASEDATPPAPDASGSQAPTDPALLLQRQRQALIQQRRDSVDRVEKAFFKAGTVIKNMNKNIFLRPKETLQEMGLLVGELAAAFLESPDATLHVMGEKTGSEDVYFHSLNVAILSMMMAKETGLGPEIAREVCVGALLHDIGLNEIPDRIVKRSPAEASKPERNFRASHVELGVALGKKIGLSAQALAVLAQHHEFTDGSGYPKGLKLEEMTPGARVVSLVNYYDNLCNPIDISKALTPHEALSYMFAHCRQKFDMRALQLLIRSLGVHPPGSIVQLSNAAFGVVTCVNPKKPLRPTVLVYDEAVPKDEAITVNLEIETDLQILKSIRPALLSPKVAAYLNPRKRITYFFDGGGTAPHGAAS